MAKVIWKAQGVLLDNSYTTPKGNAYHFFGTVPVDVTDPDDIAFFSKGPAFEVEGIVDRIKEIIKPTKPSFDYRQWLVANFRNDVAEVVIKKCPTLESLKAAREKDLVGMPKIGYVTAKKILKLVKEI